MTEIRYPEDLVRYVVGPSSRQYPDPYPRRVLFYDLIPTGSLRLIMNFSIFGLSLVTNGVMIIDDYGYRAGARSGNNLDFEYGPDSKLPLELSGYTNPLSG
jgi:hypothetical protein